MRIMKSCSQCEAMREVEMVTREELVTMKGHEITFTAQSYRCLECHEEFDTAETLDKNLESARETYMVKKLNSTINVVNLFKNG